MAAERVEPPKTGLNPDWEEARLFLAPEAEVMSFESEKVEHVSLRDAAGVSLASGELGMRPGLEEVRQYLDQRHLMNLSYQKVGKPLQLAEKSLSFFLGELEEEPERELEEALEQAQSE
jgi:hypothetical protein